MTLPNIGDRIRLTFMNDPDPIPKGTTGTVTGIAQHEDMTQIDVDWDIPRTLSLLYPQDGFEIIKEDNDARGTGTNG